jgi:hypothetical protein
MATKVYGQSDDLIEFEGDVSDEVGYYERDEESEGGLVFCSDGTALRVKYGKEIGGIWAITAIHKGSLFDRIDVCDDEDANPHSDVAYFRDGLKRAWFAREAATIR